MKLLTLGTSSMNSLGLGTFHFAKSNSRSPATACLVVKDDLNHVKHVCDRSFAPRSTTTLSQQCWEVLWCSSVRKINKSRSSAVIFDRPPPGKSSYSTSTSHISAESWASNHPTCLPMVRSAVQTGFLAQPLSWADTAVTSDGWSRTNTGSPQISSSHFSLQ